MVDCWCDGHRAGVLAHSAKHFAQIERLVMKLEPAGVRAREKKKIFGDGGELMNLVEQRIGAGLLFRGRFRIGEDFFNARAQNRDRSFQMMRRFRGKTD